MGAVPHNEAVSSYSAAAAGRQAFLDRFRWQDGHADIWRVFLDPTALAGVVDGMAEPWRERGITYVLGIESRGFLLGAAVAVNLGVGFPGCSQERRLTPWTNFVGGHSA